MGRFGSSGISCCCTRASCIFFVPDFYEDCLCFLGQRIKRFDVILKNPHQTTYAKLNPVQNKTDMQGWGDGAAEGPECFRWEWEIAFHSGFALREGLTWSKCQHSPRSVVFRWDPGFLISHNDLMENNLIKSEELPASEYTMHADNFSSTNLKMTYSSWWQQSKYTDWGSSSIFRIFFHIVFTRGSFCLFLMVSGQAEFFTRPHIIISSWQYWSFEWTKAILPVSQGPCLKVMYMFRLYCLVI